MILLFRAVSTCFTVFRFALFPLVPDLVFSHFQLVQRFYLFPPLQSILKCRPSILYWIHWDRKKNLYLLTAGALKKTRMLWSGALGKDKNRFIFSARFAAALALSACSASSQHRARLRKITRSKKLKRLWWTNVFPCPRFPSVFQALQLSMKTHAPKAQILIITIF